MKVGLFFGSFNPPHLGHLKIADFFYHNNFLQKVWFVLSPQNPFKKNSQLAPTYLRKEMLAVALKNISFAQPCFVELDLPTPTYSANTLELLKKQYPKYNFLIIMGKDNYILLEKWYRGEWIKKNFDLLVYPRKIINDKIDNGQPVQKTSKQLQEKKMINISSTMIRKKASKCEDVSNLVGKNVANYIQTNHLYSK